MLLGLGLALWAAGAMTFGDWLWAVLELRHRPQYGLAHGTLLCLWIGLYLGMVTRRIAQGALLGAVVGLAAAGSFYALAPAMGYSAMFLSWIGLWFGLAWVAERLTIGTAGTKAALIRALVAAVGSAIAFYAVSGIWFRWTGAPNYLWHFGAWLIAFLPGALALMYRPARLQASKPASPRIS